MKERRLRQLAAQAGCQIDKIIHNRHLKVLLTKNGIKGVVTVAVSSSDSARVEKNVLSDMKRVGQHNHG